MAVIRVLLVDDNPTFRQIVTGYLEDSPEMSVIGSLSAGTEALARVEELRPHVTLVDLAMPDLPGLEVIPRLRALRPDMGIIALTLLDAEGYRRAALAAGADAFVPKWTLTTTLIPAIRRVAEAGRHRPAGVEARASPDGPAPLT